MKTALFAACLIFATTLNANNVTSSSPTLMERAQGGLSVVFNGYEVIHHLEVLNRFYKSPPTSLADLWIFTIEGLEIATHSLNVYNYVGDMMGTQLSVDLARFLPTEPQIMQLTLGAANSVILGGLMLKVHKFWGKENHIAAFSLVSAFFHAKDAAYSMQKYLQETPGEEQKQHS